MQVVRVGTFLMPRGTYVSGGKRFMFLYVLAGVLFSVIKSDERGAAMEACLAAYVGMVSSL